MPLDDSTPNDGSKRAPPDPHLDPQPAREPVTGQEDLAERATSDSSRSEIVAQANTVIRGSSRVDRPIGSLHRSPAVITKVLLGQQLNQYLIEDQIGGGGMGAVFRAHDQQLDRTVAIKVIPFVGEDVDLQRRFRNEAQSAAKLDDPRIARVYDAGHHDEWHYIVFEFVEGTNIRDQVASEGVFSIDDAVYYTSQLAVAIGHLSSRGIVHRDIKPSNVIIANDGSLKLVDMGLARSDNLEMSDDMTASGVTLGTFDYISPEQARDPRNADLRSDIYSLGCTLYFMLTGSPPYPGGTMAQKLISHGTAPPPNAQEFRPAVSNHLQAVLNKMLAKSPSDRYADAIDLFADLREVARRDGLKRTSDLAPAEPGRGVLMPGWLYKFSPWIAAAIVLLTTAGWFRLESASMRDDIVIPVGASAPEPILQPNPVDADPPQASPPLDLADATDAATVNRETPNQRSPNQETSESRPPAPSSPDLASPSLLNPNRTNPNDTTSTDPGEDASTANPDPIPQRPPIIRLVADEVAVPERRDANGVVLTNRFAEAIRLAKQFKANQIEITTPIVRSEPVRIGGLNPLIIRSTVGGSEIVFREGESIQSFGRALVSVTSNRVEFEDLHFRLENDQPSESEIAFLSLRGNTHVRLKRCSLTAKTPTNVDKVFGFRISDVSPWAIFGRPTSASTESTGVEIEIKDSVIRGQLTMVSLDGNSNVKLSWDNGLLAIAGRMIEATGSRMDPGFRPQGSVDLHLQRLTAHVPLGLVRVRTSPNAPYPMSIDRQALNSLFLTNSGQPQFEFLGARTLMNLSDRLLVRGASNTYCTTGSGSDLMIRVASETEITQRFSIDDIRTDPPPWFQDLSSRTIYTPWSPEILASLKPEDRSPDDYKQHDPSSPGFDYDSLPTIPSGVESEVDSPVDRLSNEADRGNPPDFGEDPEEDLTFPRVSDLIGVPLESARRLLRGENPPSRSEDPEFEPTLPSIP